MCIDMHGQECVSIRIRRISNGPAEITIQTKQTKKAHTCVQATDMDSIHPNQSDNLQKMVKTKQIDKEYTHMCATSNHGFYTSKSQV